MSKTSLSFFLLIFWSFGLTTSENSEKTIHDDLLIGIQNAVINDNQTSFVQYYTKDFDAAGNQGFWDAWYKRYYQPLKAEERKTFILRRFGDVQESQQDVKMSFSESYNLNGNSSDIHLTSYDVILKKTSNNTIGYGINDIKQHKK